MPRFADIIGQEMAVSALKRSIKSETVAHAYLFTGPVGVGKMATALAFASALNCAGEAEDTDACGECWSCRAINTLQHPDLTILSPTGAGDETRIEQTREMIRTSSFAPVKGQYKVAVVERAESLNAESSNSILKILEEPPEYLVIILLASNPAVLLDTIHSRCQRIRLTPASLDDLQTALADRYGMSAEDAAFLAAYAEGRPGRAISLIGNTEFFERRNALSELAAAAAVRGSRWKFLKLAEQLRNIAEDDDDASTQTRRKLLAAFDTLILWYRDLLTVKLRGEEARVVNSDKRDELVRQAALYDSSKRLAASLNTLTQGKKIIARNANIQIATESVMLALTK